MADKILLVEDDPLIISSLTELLHAEGYAVDSADSQQEAISKALVSSAGIAGASTYALVLLDVTLSSGNGFAVCSAIKQAAPTLPVIFLTASDDEFNTVTGIQMGADDYIAKPFRPRELLARVGDSPVAASAASHRAWPLGYRCR